MQTTVSPHERIIPILSFVCARITSLVSAEADSVKL